LRAHALWVEQWPADDDEPHFPCDQPEEERKGTAAAQRACAHTRCVGVYSRANDGNYTTLPSGRDAPGYLMTGFDDSDGMHAECEVVQTKSLPLSRGVHERASAKPKVRVYT
jgi:hypothetical protein